MMWRRSLVSSCNFSLISRTSPDLCLIFADDIEEIDDADVTDDIEDDDDDDDDDADDDIEDDKDDLNKDDEDDDNSNKDEDDDVIVVGEKRSRGKHILL